MSGTAPPPFALEGGDDVRVVVEGSRIAEPDRPVGRRFRLSGSHIRPGLINAHDHLTINHYPRIGEPPYPNLYAWAEDVHGRFGEEVARCRTLPRHKALLFSALKNLLGGVTRAVHHDPWTPDMERLPIRVEAVRFVHSLGLDPEGGPERGQTGPTAGRPLCMHLAEGVDEVAAGEVAEAARRGLLGPDLLAVHLVAVDERDVRRLTEAGVGFVWCPSSSLHLYGRAAPPEVFGAGLDVLVGSDSLISAEGTLLHELGVARAQGRVDDTVLEAAVGAVPARRLGLPPPSLRPGAPADVVVLSRPLLEARPADVALVLVDGVPRYGDLVFSPLFGDLGVRAERLEVGGKTKLVAAPLGAVAAEVLRLTPACRRILQ